MLKRLGLKYWPMVLLVIAIGAILFVSRYAEDRKTQKAEDAQSGGPQATVTPNNASKGTDKAPKSEHHPDVIDTFAWPEGATVWALFLTLVVIAWQSTETRDAAKAAMAQIQLMKEQSHRMVGKERARLKLRCDGVDVQWGPTGTWTLFADIWIANHGSSNAYITRKWGKLLVAPFGGTRPELDDSCDILLPYPFDIIKPEGEPIRVNLALEDAPSSFRDLCIGITASRLTMHLYGFIEYETMGEGWHLPFKYRWEMSSIPDGMSERDLADDINMVGGWDNPGQQESGEYRINPN
jgi:hypothetical protein